MAVPTSRRTPRAPIAPSVSTTGRSVGIKASAAVRSERKYVATRPSTIASATAKLRSCVRLTASIITPTTARGPVTTTPQPSGSSSASNARTRASEANRRSCGSFSACALRRSA